MLLERRGEIERAKAAYRRADDGGDATGAFHLALLLEQSGQPEEAEAAYREALAQASSPAQWVRLCTCQHVRWTPTS